VEILNMGLLKNPLNWFIVVMMVVVAGIGFHFLFKVIQGGGGSAPNLANPLPTTYGPVDGGV
jgi:hypothetical protein